MNTESSEKTNVITRFLDQTIYSGRWLVAPMYFGLFVALVIYCYKFFLQIAELCHDASHVGESELMLRVLSLVDLTMVGALVVMIMIGGYSSFIRKLNLKGVKLPNWLERITGGTLKIKMATSLIGVSSIHLLKDFISVDTISWDTISKHVLIHLVFLLSAVALVLTEKWGHVEKTDTNSH